MTSIGLLIGLTRARLALLVAGLAWFVGLMPDLGIRLAIAGLVVVAVAADGWLDEQRITRTSTPPRDRHHTTT